MPHLAAHARLGLAVEMEFHVWIGEGGGPVGFTLRPDVAEEVGHCGGRAKGSGAERQAADGSDLLLELAGDAGVQREVAAVVGAGGELVDDEVAALRDEEFDGEEADDPEFLQNAAGEFDGFLREGMETMTGHSTSAAALVQMLIVPVMLTLGIAAMGVAAAVYM